MTLTLPPGSPVDSPFARTARLGRRLIMAGLLLPALAASQPAADKAVLDMREAFRGHRHFEATARFCALYDQASFDPDYDSAPLNFFEPMVRRIFAKPLHSIYTA